MPAGGYPGCGKTLYIISMRIHSSIHVPGVHSHYGVEVLASGKGRILHGALSAEFNAHSGNAGGEVQPMERPQLASSLYHIPALLLPAP